MTHICLSCSGTTVKSLNYSVQGKGGVEPRGRFTFPVYFREHGEPELSGQVKDTFNKLANSLKTREKFPHHIPEAPGNVTEKHQLPGS